MYYAGVTSAVWQRRTHKIFAAAIVIIGITMITANRKDMKSMATGSVFVLLALGWLIWLIVTEKKEPPQPQPEISRGSGNPRAPILFLIGGYNLRLSFQGPSVEDPNDKPPTYDQIVKLNNSSFLPEDYISPHCEKPPRYEDLILDMSWGAASLPPELYASSDLPFVHSYKAQETITNNSSTSFQDKFDRSGHHASTSYLLQEEFPPPSYEFTMNLHSTDEETSSDSDNSLNPFSQVDVSAPNRRSSLSVVPEEDDKILQSEVMLQQDDKTLHRDIKSSEDEEMIQDEFTSLSLRHSMLEKNPGPFKQISTNEIECPYQISTFIEPPTNSSPTLKLPIEFPANLESCTHGSANIKLPTLESNTQDTPLLSSSNPFDIEKCTKLIPLLKQNESFNIENELSPISFQSQQSETHGIPRPPSTRPKIPLPKKGTNICVLQPPPISKTRAKTTDTHSISSMSVNHCPETLFIKEKDYINQSLKFNLPSSSLQLDQESSLINYTLQPISNQHEYFDKEPTLANPSLLCHSEPTNIANLKNNETQRQHSFSSDIQRGVPCSSLQQHQEPFNTTLPYESTARLHSQQMPSANMRSNPKSNYPQLSDALSSVSQPSEPCPSLLPLSLQAPSPLESSLSSSLSKDN